MYSNRLEPNLPRASCMLPYSSSSRSLSSAARSSAADCAGELSDSGSAHITSMISMIINLEIGDNHKIHIIWRTQVFICSSYKV